MSSLATPTRVAVADDHAIVRRGIRALLERAGDIEVVGEADDGLRAVALVDKVRPDVLLLDLRMPALTGLEVLPRIRKSSTRAIMLSVEGPRHHVVTALREGAWGYILKNCTLDTLVSGIRAVADGKRYLCPGCQGFAGDTLPPAGANDSRLPFDSRDPYERLTFREKDVVHLALEGLTNGEIGGRLSISARTVEIHRAHAMQKLGLRGQVDLVRFAVRHSILPCDV